MDRCFQWSWCSPPQEQRASAGSTHSKTAKPVCFGMIRQQKKQAKFLALNANLCWPHALSTRTMSCGDLYHVSTNFLGTGVV